MSLRFFASLLTLFVLSAPAAADVLGLSTAPLHVVVATDMTGSSKNPAYQYAQQAKLIAQNVLLNQVRSGDTVTLLQICNSVKTVADFRFSGKDARLSKSDILRYSAALTQPCAGKGSALNQALLLSLQAAQRTPQQQTVVVYFTDGAFQDDPQSAALGASFDRLLKQKNVKVVYLAGLSPENIGPAGSIRDAFLNKLGRAADPRVLSAGAYDLSNSYPNFAAAVKSLRQ